MVHKHDNERPDDDDGEAGMQGGEFGLLFHRIDRPSLGVFLHALLRRWSTKNTAIYQYEHETAHGEDALHILALYPRNIRSPTTCRVLRVVIGKNRRPQGHARGVYGAPIHNGKHPKRVIVIQLTPCIRLRSRCGVHQG